MRLPKFEYLVPSDIEEAYSYLKEFNGQVAILAGGTDLVMHLKHGLEFPTHLLSLKNVTELNSLHYDRDSGFILGAMCSLRNISVNPHIKSELMGLEQAADEIASPQIRNRGTIGGNICLDSRCWYFNRSWQLRKTLPPCYKTGGDRCYVVKGGKHCYALIQADTVPSLLVLQAQLRLVGPEGERVLPIEGFYSGQGENPNRLASGEILTEIRIPRLSPCSGTVYLKYRKRRALEFPLLGISSFVQLDGEGRSCREARFAFIGHGSSPLLVDASKTLEGLDEPILTEEQITHLLQELKPISHMGVSASLKRRLSRLMLQRAFHGAWRNAQERNAEYS
jgi:4-hydroxybenzoyl-CoA reductase subunit beta